MTTPVVKRKQAIDYPSKELPTEELSTATEHVNPIYRGRQTNQDTERRVKKEELRKQKLSLQQLRAAIPKELWEKSTFWSSYYLARDILIIIFLYALYTSFEKTIQMWPLPIRFIVHASYVNAQGFMFWALYVIGHECDHNNFSNYKIVSDFVGFVTHSFVLTPYFTWQNSHLNFHHARTGNIIEMESHNPMTIETNCEEVKQMTKAHAFWGDVAYSIKWVIITIFIGWPCYLLVGATGARRCLNGDVELPEISMLNPGSKHNHFNPYSIINANLPKWKCWASTFGIVGWLASVAFFFYPKFGGWDCSVHYIIPVILQGGWVALVTKLHHQDPETIIYGEEEWDFAKGQVDHTIDRTGLETFANLMHNAMDSHVVHHLFPTIPHYNAIRATPYIRRALGDRYNCNDENPFYTLLTLQAKCFIVAGTTGVQRWLTPIEAANILKKKS